MADPETSEESWDLGAVAAACIGAAAAVVDLEEIEETSPAAAGPSRSRRASAPAHSSQGTAASPRGRVATLVAASVVARAFPEFAGQARRHLATGEYPAALAGRMKGNCDARRAFSRRVTRNYMLVDMAGQATLYRTQTPTRNAALVGDEKRKARPPSSAPPSPQHPTGLT
jgi:hypothetical protein